MLHLVNPEPEDEDERPNAFKDIRELPWWQAGLEILGYVTSILVLIELLIRWFH